MPLAVAISKSKGGPVAPRGALVEAFSVGSIVVVRTTVQVYLVHASWLPVIDPITANRLREMYDEGWTTYELARMFGVNKDRVYECVAGKRQWSHLPSIVRVRRHAAELAHG